MKSGDIELAEEMNTLFSFISTLDINRLKEFEKELSNQVSQYQAIGIIDGHDYFKKLDNIEARHNRIISLINLIDVFNKTQNKILS